MPNLHDLATTIGNSSLLSIVSALAAGLAAIALMSGAAKVRRSTLPKDFPGDSEAQLDKYVLSFTQLDQVRKEQGADVAALAEQLKNEPAAHLGLTSFQKFAADGKTKNSSASAPAETAENAEDFPQTVDLALPKTTKKGRNRQ